MYQEIGVGVLTGMRVWASLESDGRIMRQKDMKFERVFFKITVSFRLMGNNNNNNNNKNKKKMQQEGGGSQQHSLATVFVSNLPYSFSTSQ
ncbi:hypothetical protein M8C21_016623, partial [Ambrosia artemisiifolia]